MHFSATLELYQLVSEIVGSSEYPCSVGGKFCNHSTECLVCARNKVSRFDVILSYVMQRNIITLANEIIDPIDEIIFHVVQASGQSEYRRGIPANPRKCFGKNVKFTPANITAN